MNSEVRERLAAIKRQHVGQIGRRNCDVCFLIDQLEAALQAPTGGVSLRALQKHFPFRDETNVLEYSPSFVRGYNYALKGVWDWLEQEGGQAPTERDAVLEKAAFLGQQAAYASAMCGDKPSVIADSVAIQIRALKTAPAPTAQCPTCGNVENGADNQAVRCNDSWHDWPASQSPPSDTLRELMEEAERSALLLFQAGHEEDSIELRAAIAKARG